MKNSKEYGEKIVKLAKQLKRSFGAVKPPTFKEPLDAALFALVAEAVGDAAAERVIKRMRSHFIDWNDLRVSRAEEIAELFDAPSADALAAAERITTFLYAVADKFEQLSLAKLTADPKRGARKALEGLAGITPFASAYVALTAYGCPAAPITDAMIAYLKQNDLIDPNASREEVEALLERCIPAADAYGFYARLRQQMDSQTKKSAKKAAKPAKAEKPEKPEKAASKTQPKKTKKKT